MNKNNLVIVILILGAACVYLHYSKQAQQPQTSNEQFTAPEEKPATPPPADVKPESSKPVAPPVINSYSTALAAAKATNKPLLIIFGATWCHWCSELKNKTLKDAEVKKVLAKFIVYECDTDKERDIASKFGITSLPNYKILNDKETVIVDGTGYKTPGIFIQWLNSGLK